VPFVAQRSPSSCWQRPPGAAQACCRGIHLQPPRQASAVSIPRPLANRRLGAPRRRPRGSRGRGFEVDAREGRFMRNALKVMRHLRRDHRRPARWSSSAIGTNFPANSRRHPGRRWGLLSPGQNPRVRHAEALLERTPERRAARPRTGQHPPSHPHPRLAVVQRRPRRPGSTPTARTFGRPGRTHTRALLATALHWISSDNCACEGQDPAPVPSGRRAYCLLMRYIVRCPWCRAADRVGRLLARPTRFATRRRR